MLGGGLEPYFRVLLFALFQGVSLGNFHQIRNLWKRAEAKVWSFVVNLRTNSLCVWIIGRLSTRLIDESHISEGRAHSAGGRRKFARRAIMGLCQLIKKPWINLLTPTE